ncbi:hypothetical protein ColTof4_09823 [Colletotrichum tofieldiae]|uniref:Uncharacterized protein n=1 Tax=Colletotrichum tofieldiae TaxID=708197 RepID=A0A166X517_9PEZI|nr:hypothetical protein CT0861_02844 [Colletotrichum tofieldiae]GKT57841.1 hypothetical protein ColTof3_05180 [Colletotrichum tofieldiae]GKT77400.1 hypothetical protein ColTof4_09823 [Colletotrichum tofieldiae]GKT86198.1 hypothetical protein Ct61P_04048 [Colletotrichum tofieldiae]
MDRAMDLRDMDFESAIVDDEKDVDFAANAATTPHLLGRSPLSKTRSMSDGGGTPSKLTPSPHVADGRQASKDDNHIRDTATTPVTPRRSEFPLRGLSLQMPSNRDPASPASTPSAAFTKPAPLSPKLDHSQIYASPTNILPRRSRGLDFSRAATSLHHSTLAESSPDSSPTIGGRGMNIPGRRSNDYGQAEQTTNSLWSMMGNHERMTVSSSLGSANQLGSDSSSSSDDDDLMDEDTDEPYIGTPQANKTAAPLGIQPMMAPWGGSPAMNSLMSFQHRQRQRKLPKKKHKLPLGLGFSPSTNAGVSKSPPSTMPKDISGHSRRESISWQANQLHISGSEEERGDNIDGLLTTPSRDGQRPTVMRRVVTRRGNLLPKTKNFARIRAALFEEGAPVETETQREAEVVRQVRESDVDLGGARQQTAPATTHSSPTLGAQDQSLDDIPESMITESALHLSGSFKQQALKNSKGTKFWDTFSESSSIGTRTTPPPPNGLPRGSSSGMSEDICMDSPSLGPTAGFAMAASSGESQKGDTPLLAQGPQPAPSAADITRRINSKRRRDDDYDPVSLKRRAVSPGMSVHNSPIMQSPMQRDVAPWGSRPGSNSGDRGGSGAPSESGSLGGTPGSGANANANANGRVNGNKGRVGFQGMVDTNDGLMRMSIE